MRRPNKQNVKLHGTVKNERRVLFAFLGKADTPMTINELITECGEGIDNATYYRITRRFTDNGWATSQWRINDDERPAKEWKLTPEGREVAIDVLEVEEGE